MKLILKNLKQVPHNVEVESDQVTVEVLKKEIEKAHGFDSGCLKLLFNGIVLDNAKTLESYNIKEDYVLIMMNTKAKPVNVEKKEPEKKAEVSQEKPSTDPQHQAKPNPNPQPLQQPLAQPKPVQPEKDYSKEVTNLVEMGFIKGEAEAAIKAAKGNVELAIEFLYNGIPQNFDLPKEVPIQGGSQQGGSAQIGQMTEFQKAARIIKVICSQNPASLQSILLNIQQQDPELMNQIKENEAEFKNILQQPITQEDIKLLEEFSAQSGLHQGGHQHGGSGTEQRGDGRKITLTKEEFDAVKRIQDMGGFNQMEVVQAYFACDKNEELAANFLFENKMNEQEFGINIVPSRPNQPLQPPQNSQLQPPLNQPLRPPMNQPLQPPQQNQPLQPPQQNQPLQPPQQSQPQPKKEDEESSKKKDEEKKD